MFKLEISSSVFFSIYCLSVYNFFQREFIFYFSSKYLFCFPPSKETVHFVLSINSSNFFWVFSSIVWQEVVTCSDLMRRYEVYLKLFTIKKKMLMFLTGFLFSKQKFSSSYFNASSDNLLNFVKNNCSNYFILFFIKEHICSSKIIPLKF